MCIMDGFVGEEGEREREGEWEGEDGFSMQRGCYLHTTDTWSNVHNHMYMQCTCACAYMITLSPFSTFCLYAHPISHL